MISSDIRAQALHLNVNRSFTRIGKSMVEPYFLGQPLSIASYSLPPGTKDMNSYSGPKRDKDRINILRAKAVEGKRQTELSLVRSIEEIIEVIDIEEDAKAGDEDRDALGEDGEADEDGDSDVPVPSPNKPRCNNIENRIC